MLKGYKTYIIASLMALLTTANMMGFISTEQFGAIMALLGSFGLATLRQAVGEVPEKVAEVVPPVQTIIVKP